MDTAPFLKSLYDIVNGEDSSIIRWTKDGLGFEITNTEVLENNILGKYFRHQKFASFQRQLNYFGFKKWSKSKSSYCTYSQYYFRKGRYTDLRYIHRKESRILFLNKKNKRKLPPVLNLNTPKHSNTLRDGISPTVKGRDNYENFGKDIPLLENVLHSKWDEEPYVDKTIMLDILTDMENDSEIENKHDEACRDGQFVEDSQWMDDMDYLTKSSPKLPFAPSPMIDFLQLSSPLSNDMEYSP